MTKNNFVYLPESMKYINMTSVNEAILDVHKDIVILTYDGMRKAFTLSGEDAAAIRRYILELDND